MYDLRRRQNIRLYLEISPHSPQRQHIAAMSMFKDKYNIIISYFRIRNERIRGTTKVGETSKKVQESRLKTNM